MPRDLPDAVVRYADHEDAVLDVHLPDGRAERLVVLLHGGFWRSAWDRTHTRPMARALADEGCVVATPEYRRVGDGRGGGGGWPVTCEDVLTATTRTPELLRDLDLPVPGTTVLTGHSAGGHLALWLACRGIAADRFVPLAPVGDLGEAVRRNLGDGATSAFLDGADPGPADPMVLLSAGLGAEIVIVHGVADDVVPVELSRGLVEQHGFVRLEEVPGGHVEVIEPGSVAWPSVCTALFI